MKHRVLIITTVSGFLWQFERNTVEILKEQEAEIHFASNFSTPAYQFPQDYFQENGIFPHHVSVQKSPYKIIKNFRALKSLLEIIRKENIDTLHCHTPVGAVLGRLAARFSPKKPKVIYTAHGFHFYQGAPLKNWLLYYPAEWFLARYTDILVTINHEDEKRAKGLPIKDGGWVMKIPGVGVERSRFCPRPMARERARESLGLKDGELCLLTAALLDKEKNYQIVLEALEGLTNLPFRYFICGEGPYREALEEKAKKLGLEEKVCFLGFRRDLDFLLQAADIFLFPSLREGLGMAALEAMSCGVPVIATENRGTREYIRHEKNGLLCSGWNKAEFQKAISLLSQDRTLGSRLGGQAWADSSRFSKEESRIYMKQVYRLAWKGADYEKSDARDAKDKNHRVHERVQSPSSGLTERGRGICLESEFS